MAKSKRRSAEASKPRARRSEASASPVIQRAQAELGGLRESYAAARGDLLEVIRTGQASSFDGAVRLVRVRTKIEPGAVQRALWALVQDRQVSLGDGFEVRLSAPEAVA